MPRPVRVLVCFMALFALAGVTSPASAAAPQFVGKGCHASNVRGPDTIVIDGRVYGPKDGLKVDTYECELRPGSGDVGVVFGGGSAGGGSVTPMYTWGTSYAISTEWWSQLGYDGKAKANANIWNGRRYIQVCMWYERPAGTRISNVVCSTAASTGGSWLSGPEVTMSQTDSLWPWDPPMVFRASTATISA